MAGFFPFYLDHLVDRYDLPIRYNKSIDEYILLPDMGGFTKNQSLILQNQRQEQLKKVIEHVIMTNEKRRLHNLTSDFDERKKLLREIDELNVIKNSANFVESNYRWLPAMYKYFKYNDYTVIYEDLNVNTYERMESFADHISKMDNFSYITSYGGDLAKRNENLNRENKNFYDNKELVKRGIPSRFPNFQYLIEVVCSRADLKGWIEGKHKMQLDYGIDVVALMLFFRVSTWCIRTCKTYKNRRLFTKNVYAWDNDDLEVVRDTTIGMGEINRKLILYIISQEKADYFYIIAGLYMMFEKHIFYEDAMFNAKSVWIDDIFHPVLVIPECFQKKYNDYMCLRGVKDNMIFRCDDRLKCEYCGPLLKTRKRICKKMKIELWLIIFSYYSKVWFTFYNQRAKFEFKVKRHEDKFFKCNGDGPVNYSINVEEGEQNKRKLKDFRLDNSDEDEPSSKKSK